MEQAARAAGIADNVDPDTAPSRDVEAGKPIWSNHGANASRASLPLSHRKSLSITGPRGRAESTRTNSNIDVSMLRGDASIRDGDAPIGTAITTGDDLDEAPADGEIPWGPEHPCFPHPNPHVPVSSTLYASTRIIRVRRDWMIAGDLAPTYSLMYPEILDYFPCFSEESFRDLIQQVNQMLQTAFSPWSKGAWLDQILGVATGWLWDDLRLSMSKHSIAQVEAFLESWNQRHGAAAGVYIIPLWRTGYLSIDIQIPDPHIVDADEMDTELDTQTENEFATDGEADTTGTRTREHSISRSSLAGRPGSAKSSTRSRSASASRRDVSATARADPAQPVVPPIPNEYLQDNSLLNAFMGGLSSKDNTTGQTT